MNGEICITIFYEIFKKMIRFFFISDILLERDQTKHGKELIFNLRQNLEIYLIMLRHVKSVRVQDMTNLKSKCLREQGLILCPV